MLRDSDHKFVCRPLYTELDPYSTLKAITQVLDAKLLPYRIYENLFVVRLTVGDAAASWSSGEAYMRGRWARGKAGLLLG